MKNETFEQIMKCIKLLNKDKIVLPGIGIQNKHMIHNKENYNDKYCMIINRKGHLRDDTLTYIMISNTHGTIVRLDMVGSPHENRGGEIIEPPHVHIFDEEHKNGKVAEPLSCITNQCIVNVIHDSLEAFLIYNNVDTDEIEIPII